MESEQTFILKVEKNEETGEFFITPPEGMLDKMGWKPGDKIDWIDNKNGTFTLIKVE